MLKKALVSLLLIVPTLWANQQDMQHTTPMGIPTLSEHLRAVLNEEMVALEKGMKEIFSSMIKGDYKNIEEIAATIQHSFILEQKLSSQEKEELHTKLPQNFIVLDRTFHNDAQMLQHVANAKNPELTSFYFNKMTNACVTCHQSFAQEKFPKLNTLLDNTLDHHK